MVILTTLSYSKSARAWILELDRVDISSIREREVSSFWNAERNADADYNSLQQAILKNKKNIRSAEANISNFIYSSSSARNYIAVNDSAADAICCYIERDLHIEDIKMAYPGIACENLKFKISASYEFNASTFPDGYILINMGLLSALDYDELLAVCAHELVHYMFSHSLAKEYAYIKKQKSNRLWAEIGGALIVGANAFADGYNSGATGQQMTNYQYYEDMYQGIIDDAAESAERFKFRYSRRDELQADILGYRYLQFLGHAPSSFLTMLEKIGIEDDKYYNKKSAHPKTALRIEIIKAMLEKDKRKIAFDADDY